MRRTTLALLGLLAQLLAGCDLLGIESASALAARREAEGKAIGGACRHAARSIEQCYGSNKKADKAAVFAGWREMNDYMRENKIEAMPAAQANAPAEDEDEEAAPERKGGAKAEAGKAERPDKPGKPDKPAQGKATAKAAAGSTS
ncbi:MAG: hypothetical protein JNL30_19310 [Rubrivivax sp.]|nr:hypothetical protein [Rubrivivax sp.]